VATQWQLVHRAAGILESAGVPSSRLEAEVLLAHLLEVDRLELYKHPHQSIGKEKVNAYRQVIDWRVRGVPTAYLRQKKEFFSRTFQVGPGVLIPRAETELLVEEGLRILQNIKTPRILDLGTGSGAIVISLLAELPNARGVGSDISEEALQYASKNAQMLKVNQRLELLQGQLFLPIAEHEPFDLVISNPPYIRTNEIPPDLRFEPREAFDGGTDGLRFYRDILKQAYSLMKPNAALILETGDFAQEELDRELENHAENYSEPRYQNDLAGKLRVMILQRKLPE